MSGFETERPSEIPPEELKLIESIDEIFQENSHLVAIAADLRDQDTGEALEPLMTLAGIIDGEIFPEVVEPHVSISRSLLSYGPTTITDLVISQRPGENRVPYLFVTLPQTEGIFLHPRDQEDIEKLRHILGYVDWDEELSKNKARGLQEMLNFDDNQEEAQQ